MKSLRIKLIIIVCPVVLLLAISFWSWFAKFYSADSAPTPHQNAELDPAKQKLIWDNEHITFEIEKRFGKSFLVALKSKNRDKLQSLLLSDFDGNALARHGGRTRQKGPLSEVRFDAKIQGIQTVTAAGMADALLASLSHFKKIDRSMLRVLQIESITASKNRWKAKLLLGFVGSDKNDKRLLLESEHWIECQIDDEMAIDRVASVRRWEMEYEVLRRCDAPLMEEVSADYQLNDLGILDNWHLQPSKVYQNRFQFAVADYNRDGFLDIAVAPIGQQPLLLQSIEGKRFAEVAAKRGVTQASTFAKMDYAAAWIDYDNDGWPDLIMNGRLYHNDQGQRFEDVTANSGLAFEPECMGCTVVDYDGDGLLDLYVLYQRNYRSSAPRQEQWVNDENSGQPNQLWRNEGNGRFRDFTKVARAGGGTRHTHAAAWFFHDDDHYPDVYLANDFGKNVLLRNRGDGTFEDISEQSGAASFATSMGVVSGDIDNDGRPDLYVANMFSKMGRRIIGQLCNDDYPPGIFPQIQGSCAGNQLYLRKSPKGKYRDFSIPYQVNKVGWAYGPAMSDLDGDGWLDLYATTGFLSFTRNEPDG